MGLINSEYNQRIIAATQIVSSINASTTTIKLNINDIQNNLNSVSRQIATLQTALDNFGTFLDYIYNADIQNLKLRENKE